MLERNSINGLRNRSGHLNKLFSLSLACVVLCNLLFVFMLGRIGLCVFCGTSVNGGAGVCFWNGGGLDCLDMIRAVHWS